MSLGTNEVLRQNTIWSPDYVWLSKPGIAGIVRMQHYSLWASDSAITYRYLGEAGSKPSPVSRSLLEAGIHTGLEI